MTAWIVFGTLAVASEHFDAALLGGGHKVAAAHIELHQRAVTRHAQHDSARLTGRRVTCVWTRVRATSRTCYLTAAVARLACFACNRIIVSTQNGVAFLVASVVSTCQ